MTTRTDAGTSNKAEQAEPAKDNSLPTKPHSKQGGVPERNPFRQTPRRTASDCDDISRMKDKIESSEQSVIKLKTHGKQHLSARLEL